jgi:hypothetical protein
MSADDIRWLLQRLSQADSPPTCTNQFQGLIVEETSEDVSNSPLVAEATCERQPKRPQWEKRLPKQLKIGAAEVGPNTHSIYGWKLKARILNGSMECVH